MIELLQQPFFQRAVLAGILASVACGVVGTLVVVRRMASLSGALAHGAFAGVGLGFFLGFPPVAGAAAVAALAGTFLGFMFRRLRGGMDTLISTLWPVGMAVGMVFVALTPGYAPDLMSYLFGSILFVPVQYLWFLAATDAVVLLVVLLFFHDLQAVAFDEEYAEARGLPVVRLMVVLMVLVALTVVALIQVVGVVLVLALLTMPAAAARVWVTGLKTLMVWAVSLGALCTLSGLFLAWLLSRWSEAEIPPGPVIILITAVAYGLSLIFGRNRD